MTFLQIRQRIAELLGLSSIDRTPDDNATIENKLKAWTNARYKVIAGKRSWNWLITDTIIQTYADITTGTVTATQDSSTITFSSGPTASVAQWFIQFSDTEDWYEISTHTAASTTAVLTVPYLGTTSAILTYKLRKVYYSLPSTTQKVLNIRQTRNDQALRYVPIRQLDRLIPDRTRLGTPEFYTVSGLDSSRNYKMQFYPVSDSRMNLNARLYQTVTDMTDDSDVPLIPEAFHDVLVWDVLGTYGYIFLDDTRLAAARVEYASIYKDMKDNDVAGEDVAVRLAFDLDFTSKDNFLNNLSLPIIP